MDRPLNSTPVCIMKLRKNFSIYIYTQCGAISGDNCTMSFILNCLPLIRFPILSYEDTREIYSCKSDIVIRQQKSVIIVKMNETYFLSLATLVFKPSERCTKVYAISVVKWNTRFAEWIAAKIRSRFNISERPW